MAPPHIDLGETSRWLAQLHTANLTPAHGAPTSSSSSSASSSSSTRSRGGSADLSPTTSSSSSSSSGSPTSPVDSGSTTCLLTKSRARSLQRLCDLSDANARFSPTKIDYVKAPAPRGRSASLATMATTAGRTRWCRKASGPSLEAMEGSPMRRFSFSKFRLR